MGKSLRGPQAAVSGVVVRYGREGAEWGGVGAGPQCLWGTWPKGQVWECASPAGWPGQLCAAAVPSSVLPAPGHGARQLLPSLQRYAWPHVAEPLLLPPAPQPSAPYLPHLPFPALPQPPAPSATWPSHPLALERSSLLVFSSSYLSLPLACPDYHPLKNAPFLTTLCSLS